MSEPVVLQWSGGKDSALALEALTSDRGADVVGLLVSHSDADDRVTMHGVRRELVDAQAQALGQPLVPMTLPTDASNAVYEARLRDALSDVMDRGISTVATGDVFLDDVRQYREDRLGEIGMALWTPLWGEDSATLVGRFADAGFKAVTVCVSAEHLDARFLGQPLDRTFLDRLPPGIDPCGEHGEHHSFVYDGPRFAWPIDVRLGEIVSSNGHWYQDLIPGA